MKKMRYIKRILVWALILAMLPIAAKAAESPKALIFKDESYVTVTGTAIDKAGEEAFLLLVKNTANFNALCNDDIGFISQTQILADGKYMFEFVFDSFTYDSNGNVDNYSLMLNIGGVFSNETVGTASSADFLSFEGDLTQFGGFIAVADNKYKLRGFPYVMILSFYSEEGNLLKIKTQSKHTGGDNTVEYSYNEIPEDTAFVKGMIWQGFSGIIPLGAVKITEKEKSVDTLIIGNEFASEASQFLTPMAAEDGAALSVKTMSADGAGLIEHWNYMSNNAAVYSVTENGVAQTGGNVSLKNVIEGERKFDVIIIQPDKKDGAKTLSSLLKIIREIKNHQPGAEVLLYQN